MVQTLKPLPIIEVPLLLGVDALIHILHRKLHAMGEVVEIFLGVSYPHLGIY